MLGGKGFRVFIVCTTTILLASLFLTALVVVALNSSQVVIGSSGSVISGLPNADYYVIESSGTYYAENSNGQLLQAGMDAATIINSVFQMMYAGQKIVIRGNILLSSTLLPIAGIYIDFGSSTICAQTSMQYMINFAYKNSLTVGGGHFYGYGSTNGFRSYVANSVTIKDAIFENFGGTVITCDSGNGHVVQNDTIKNGQGNWAIAMNEAGNSLITQNNIDSNGDGSGIGIFSFSNGAVGQNEISYNIISGWSDVLWHAIYVQGVPDTIIHDNTISNPNVASCGVAILVKSLRTLIYNNIIDRVYGGWAIHIYKENPQDANSPSGTIVYNNTFSNSNIGGIYLGAGIDPVSGVRIESNQFTNMAVPIMVEGSSAGVQVINATIQNNTFSNNTYGVRAGWSGGQGYADLLNIVSNSFTSIGPNPAVLIELETTHVTIAYNIFSSCTTNIQDKTGQASIYGNIG